MDISANPAILLIDMRCVAFRKSALVAVAALFLPLGCSKNEPSQDPGDKKGIKDSSTESSGGTDEDGNTKSQSEDQTLPDSNATSTKPAKSDLTISGRVLGPNGVLPIDKALVYATSDSLSKIEEIAYCESCVELPSGTPWTMTKADGSFSLPTFSGKNQKFVVRKGQFRRASTVDLEPGAIEAPSTWTTLPNQWDPSKGQWIPKIAIFAGENDQIQDLLAKFGLAKLNKSGQWVKGSGSIDVIDTGNKAFSLLSDLEKMKKYHIIFVPCGAELLKVESQSNADLEEALNPALVKNIQEYVKAGGKWFITDRASKFLTDPFPQYQTMHQHQGSPKLPIYATTGIVKDPDLVAWLKAIPEKALLPAASKKDFANLPAIHFEDNWTAVKSVKEILGKDEAGNTSNIGHKVWVEEKEPDLYPPNLMTISAPYACGRILFSTYHTSEGAHLGQTPQEFLLLHLILNIGVCQEKILPPPL